ncbi:MAG: two-component regulator propeller domain-containing protein, partial [Bacteroidota bacterium]|nr:two-component regulator propeller domain-containing protein [Bacteroidota bacterium]
MKKITTFFIALFLGMVFGYAQMVNNRFQHITSDDGLSQNTIRCILQDRKGFMWFGTWNGLDRYDGYNFKVYKSNSNDRNSLSGNFIHSLCQDRLGNLWIATNNGLDKFVLDKETIEHYRYNPHSNNSISSLKINCIIQDHLGNLWIGTDDRGVDKLVYSSDEQKYIRFKHYSMSPGIKSTFPGNQVSAILEDKLGNIWIGTSQGLCRFNPWNESVKIFQTSGIRTSISNNQILSLYQDKKGILWVGTMYGLNKKSIFSDQFTRYFNNPDNKYSLFHNTVTSIIEDKEGDLIVGTLGGICKFNRKQNNFTGYKHSLDDVNSLNNDFINCLFSDRDGIIWIGTDKGGVNKYNIYQKKFEYYRNNPSDNNSLSHNTINSIFEDHNFLWIGTAGGGLNLYDKQERLFRHYVHLPHQANSISSNFITAIFRDSEGNTWLGTWGEGLNKIVDLKKRNGSFISYQHNENNRSSLINNFVSSIMEDRYGNLWVGTQGGLDIFDRKNKRFVHPFNNKAGIPAFNEVGCLKQDKEGNLWVGTKFGLYEIPAKYIFTFNYNNAKIKTVYYSNNYSDKFSLSGNYVISVAEDSKGNLWFGTYGNGVDKLVYGKDHKKYFVNYTENNGLANNVVYGILEDDQGDIWFSTDNGLSKYSPKTRSFRNYYVNDGLQSNQFYWTSCFKNPEGKMYFGSINGLTAFKPSDLHKSMQMPIPVVTDFKIKNISVPVGVGDGHKLVLQKSIAYTQKIVLSYKDNDVSFDFSAMNNVFPEKNQYAYHLEGFESKWNYVSSNRRFAHYTNLKGGKYVFQVKAANSDGVWNNTPV